MTISNEQGRAMEFKFAKDIISYVDNKGLKVIQTPRAELANKRDEMHWIRIPLPLKEDFSKAAKAFILWAEKNNWFDGADSLTLDRLPDGSGVRGVVTDISLSFSKLGLTISKKDISLKHHHNALKHPRLPRLPGQCGITDKKIKEDYLKMHDKIWNLFYSQAQKILPSSTAFNKVKAVNATFIEKSLYKPLINLVITFLKNHVSNRDNLALFFKFLTGDDEYYVIKNEKHGILIKHFSNIPAPRGFQIIYPYNNTLTTFLMKFDNGWDLTFRLHTASTDFFRKGKIQTSAKFDVICVNINDVVKTEIMLK